MFRSLCLLLALWVGRADGHAQCYTNERPPDEDDFDLVFCPSEQFGGEDFLQFGSCCTEMEEAVIQTEFEKAVGISNDCAFLYKQVLCGQCHSFSAHLFESLPGLGPFDGMTMKQEFCDELIAKCGTQIDFNGPAEYGGLTYCEKHVGGINGADQLWSYPYTDPIGDPQELTKLFPNIANGDMPRWLLSMRQTPDASMWWILEIQGKVKMVPTDDLDSIFDVVNISDGDLYLGTEGVSKSEEGLLDLTFDPKWSDNSFFYLSHSVALGVTNSDGENLAQNRISRFTYTAGDTTATRNSELVLLTTDAKFNTIHSAGWLGFKPSDYNDPSTWNDLYWATGDGGPGTDPFNSGQNLNNLLGAIIRISVPTFEGASDLYRIPTGNYQDVDSSAAPELCAAGLRNPWRCSFDRLNDDLWCGDAGQVDVEEVDIIECGKNYGWSRFEGHSCQAAVEDNEFNPPCAGVSRAGFEFPIYEYCHPDTVFDDPDYTGGVDICGDREVGGTVIIGGFVYRGSYFSELLYGAYIFADHRTRFIYFIKRTEEGVWKAGTIFSDFTSNIFISFSEDANGELYLITRQYDIFLLPCGDLCDTTCLNQSDQQPSVDSLGCFADQAGKRALQLDKAITCNVGERYMSPLICASYCSTVTGAVYAGVEAGTDCYCGAAGENFGKNGELGEESCQTLCEADPESTCGGMDAIEVFEIGDTLTPPPGTIIGDTTCVNDLPGFDGSSENGDVCCPLECNQCGGLGCGSNGDPGFGSTQCCINGVLNNQPDCNDSGAAPCVVTDVVAQPTPAPATPPTAPTGGGTTCVNDLPGIDGSNENGNVCCPLECNQCGDVGCGSNGDPGFGNTECCINGVLNKQPDCDDSGAAPCVVTDVITQPTPAPANPPTAPTGGGTTCTNDLPGIDGSNENGDVCCPLECNQCGDAGCATSGLPDYDNTGCCINGVLNNQPDCSDSGAAPCVVTDVISQPAPAPVTPPTPAPATPPTAPTGGGTTCVNGLPGIDGSTENGDVCCPLECNQCGGAGCATSGLPDYDNTGCCVSGVLNNQPDCSDSGAAPCVVTDGGPTCSNGISGIDGSNENGDVCCPLECHQCGGAGCGSNGDTGFGNAQCCITGVLNNQPDCADSDAAPCVITD